jgi:hypothetical protein
MAAKANKTPKQIKAYNKVYLTTNQKGEEEEGKIHYAVLTK